MLQVPAQSPKATNPVDMNFGVDASNFNTTLDAAGFGMESIGIDPPNKDSDADSNEKGSDEGSHWESSREE